MKYIRFQLSYILYLIDILIRLQLNRNCKRIEILHIKLAQELITK